MLPFWQRKNDRLATVMIGMAAFYKISPAMHERKARYWAKCVYWGEPPK
jgi:hypothetical protein